MKKLLFTSIFALLFAGGGMIMAQKPADAYLGLPGDNLNLFAVMNLFQESETLEGFERSLNDPESVINNLDLNGDGYVDYLIVTDHVNGSVHTIVLSVALNKYEYQDVAVFTVEKFRDGSVQVQLIGDEALYGKNYIIEPIYAETPNPGYTGNRGKSARVVTTTYYEVAAWPVVRYIYSPVYTVWRPAWRWGYYPVYWQPYQAHYWHYYHGYHYNLHNHYITYYRPWHHHRVKVYHNTYYTSMRRHSPTVIVMINKGNYKSTYNRPEKKKEGQAHYERVFAQNNSRGTTVRRAATPASNAPARQARQETVRQAASPAGSTTPRSNRATRVQSSKEQSQRSRTSPARVQENRSESRSSTRAVRVQESRTESRSNTRATTVRSSKPESRSRSEATPAQKSRTESRTAPARVKSSNEQPQRSRTSPARTQIERGTAVKAKESRTETRSNTRAVKESRTKESNRNAKDQRSRK